MSHPVCVKARWAQLCPRLAQHRLGLAHLAVILMLFPSFFVVFAIGLLRRFLYDPLALVLCRTLVTRITFLWSFPKPGLHTCFGLNLTRGLNKSHVFASRPSFTESAVLHKNHVLAGPVQALFAARMALSMVAKTAEGG